ncbi:MAG: histidine triad nucleotide-binding protein [Coriobacteriales bacterium]|nr:histidine triad nucleotide-binding protein [Actinomycetes bacterium]
MSECIFCMIAAGQVPAKIVYETPAVVAFDDLSPQAPVHTLIIPRSHYTDLGDGVPDQVRAALLAAVPEVARIKGVAESGYRLIINNGADAMQSVQHLHLHVLGGRAMSHGMVHFADEE